MMGEGEPFDPDKVFKSDLRINDRITLPQGIPVCVLLQAMTEYQHIPHQTPAIHQILSQMQREIVNPEWLKEQDRRYKEAQAQYSERASGLGFLLMGGSPPIDENDPRLQGED